MRGLEVGGFLGNSVVCPGKQMLQAIAAVEEKLMLHSDSIHSSKKARKRPSSEVITQEALLQARHR